MPRRQLVVGRLRSASLVDYLGTLREHPGADEVAVLDALRTGGITVLGVNYGFDYHAQGAGGRFDFDGAHITVTPPAGQGQPVVFRSLEAIADQTQPAPAPAPAIANVLIGAGGVPAQLPNEPKLQSILGFYNGRIADVNRLLPGQQNIPAQEIMNLLNGTFFEHRYLRQMQDEGILPPAVEATIGGQAYQLGAINPNQLVLTPLAAGGHNVVIDRMIGLLGQNNGLDNVSFQNQPEVENSRAHFVMLYREIADYVSREGRGGIPIPHIGWRVPLAVAGVGVLAAAIFGVSQYVGGISPPAPGATHTPTATALAAAQSPTPDLQATIDALRGQLTPSPSPVATGTIGPSPSPSPASVSPTAAPPTAVPASPTPGYVAPPPSGLPPVFRILNGGYVEANRLYHTDAITVGGRPDAARQALCGLEATLASGVRTVISLDYQAQIADAVASETSRLLSDVCRGSLILGQVGIYTLDFGAGRLRHQLGLQTSMGGVYVPVSLAARDEFVRAYNGFVGSGQRIQPDTLVPRRVR